jgi:predicted nucleic acid-binding protein
MPNARRSCFVDTNILLYTKDRTMSAKRVQAEHWLANLTAHEALTINTQVMSEFAGAVLRRFPHVTRDELGNALAMMGNWRQAEIAHRTVMLAHDLMGRIKSSWYDSMLLASAIGADCTIFLSEDQQHGGLIDGLRIVNPFQADPVAFFAAN